MQRIFIKKYFLFTVRGVCRLKRFTTGCKRFANEEVERKVQRWLRRQSKDFYSAGFGALAKRWDKCTNVGGGYVEK
jgi:hypothetical protein